MNAERQNGHDPRYDGIYQRSGTGEAAPRTVSTAPRAPELSTAPASPGLDEPALIREVGPAAPEQPEYGTLRNPIDLWIWVVAAALLGLGAYFLSAPALYEQAYRERYAGEPTLDPYTMPWFNYTVAAAPPLILIGLATAVVQLFVLSLRHTLRRR